VVRLEANFSNRGAFPSPDPRSLREPDNLRRAGPSRMFDGLARDGELMRLDAAMAFLGSLPSQDRAARRGGKFAEGDLVVASKLGLIAFSPRTRDGGANGDGRIRFLVCGNRIVRPVAQIQQNLY
jgi:hypothetical protein